MFLLSILLFDSKKLMFIEMLLFGHILEFPHEWNNYLSILQELQDSTIEQGPFGSDDHKVTIAFAQGSTLCEYDYVGSSDFRVQFNVIKNSLKTPECNVSFLVCTFNIRQKEL